MTVTKRRLLPPNVDIASAVGCWDTLPYIVSACIDDAPHPCCIRYATAIVPFAQARKCKNIDRRVRQARPHREADAGIELSQQECRQGAVCDDLGVCLRRACGDVASRTLVPQPSVHMIGFRQIDGPV